MTIKLLNIEMERLFAQCGVEIWLNKNSYTHKYLVVAKDIRVARYYNTYQEALNDPEIRTRLYGVKVKRDPEKIVENWGFIKK